SREQRVEHRLLRGRGPGCVPRVIVLMKRLENRVRIAPRQAQPGQVASQMTRLDGHPLLLREDPRRFALVEAAIVPLQAEQLRCAEGVREAELREPLKLY